METLSGMLIPVTASGNCAFNLTNYTLTTTIGSTPPTYSQVSTNNTNAGQPTNFAINVTDNYALNPNGMYIFSTNNSNGSLGE